MRQQNPKITTQNGHVKNTTHKKKKKHKETKITKINNKNEKSFKEKLILYNSSSKILNMFKMVKEISRTRII